MAKVFKRYREASRTGNWGRYYDDGNDNPNNDDLKTGAILRIADSLEKIEKPFADLIYENKRLKDDREWYRKRNATLKKRVAAYKGIVNRMKKQK